MSTARSKAEQYVDRLEARDWDAWTALLDPGVVYEMPQSRERIRGRDRYLEFNQRYPADWHLRRKLVIADESHAVIWLDVTADGATVDAIAFLDFAGGLVTRITDFWPEPSEPQAWRAHLVERY